MNNRKIYSVIALALLGFWGAVVFSVSQLF